jgi:exopolysaccharide biosynthesis polyprenyl glycosylphosphotransferase
MPSRRSLYKAAQFICDLIALTVAWYGAVFLRVLLNPFAGMDVALPDAHRWAAPLGWILVLWMLVAASHDVYIPGIRLEAGPAVRRAGECTLMVLLVTTSVMYFTTDFSRGTSRSFMLIFSPIGFGLLALSRFSAHALASRIARNFPARHYVAVVGEPEAAAALAERFSRQPEHGVIRGIVVPRGASAWTGETIRTLGTAGDLAAIINREEIAHLLLVNSRVPYTDAEMCGTVAARMGVTVSWAFCSEDASQDVPVIEVPPRCLLPWQQHAKRLLDIAGALSALVLLSPLMLLIAVAVKATSKGPLLYRSPRVGKGGKYFTFLKFRSMYTDRNRASVATLNERDGHIFKIRKDPRVTPAGRILRRLSFDELPQLFNVLRGDMSLVGPRPLPAEDLGPDGMSQRFIIWSKQRSQTPPGITGLWQIRGRSNLPFDAMLLYDQEYVRNWSLMLDLIILLKTPLFVLLGDGAY